jgi:hypothetical protein
MRFGKGLPLTAEQRAVHGIRADETLALHARIAELEAECENTSRYANKLEDVLRLINLASLKPNGSKEECGVIAREAINGHI